MHNINELCDWNEARIEILGFRGGITIISMSFPKLKVCVNKIPCHGSSSCPTNQKHQHATVPSIQQKHLHQPHPTFNYHINHIQLPISSIAMYGISAQ